MSGYRHAHDLIRDWQARQEAAKDAYYRTSDDAAKREKKRAYDAARYAERKAANA